MLIETGEGNDVVGLFGDEKLGLFPSDVNAIINTGPGDDFVHCGNGILTVNTGEGNDTVRFFGPATFVDTGPGDDYVDFIEGWRGGAIDLGPGNDYIYTNNGGFPVATPVVIRGGEGNDTLDLHEFGDSFVFPFFGGPGRDTLYLGGWQRQFLDMRDYPDVEDAIDFQRDTRIIGNDLDNYLAAMPGAVNPMTIHGGGGDDTIVGAGASDMLDGGEGNDLIRGDEGNDTIVGGEGNDTLVAGPGANLLRGGAGDDWLIAFADKFPDTLDGGTGFDRVLLAGESDDLLLNIERTLPAGQSRLVVEVLP